MVEKRGRGRPRDKETLAALERTNIGVSRDTRDKLKRMAGPEPITKFLERFANSGSELKDFSARTMADEVNKFLAAIIHLPAAAMIDADAYPSNIEATAKSLEKGEIIAIEAVRSVFEQARQLELPETGKRPTQEAL